MRQLGEMKKSIGLEVWRPEIFLLTVQSLTHFEAVISFFAVIFFICINMGEVGFIREIFRLGFSEWVLEFCGDVFSY